MVGVPGKYKGCNTCRTRRVKCDNERPFCRKCIDTGRTCDGYKRETVFIIGTIEDQGRCSSHPPRVVKSSKRGKSASSSSSRRGDDYEKLELVANEPLRPAWDDLISVSKAGKTYHVQNAALHTSLDAVTRRASSNDSERDDGAGIVQSNYVSLPPYEPPVVQPPFVNQGGDFRLRSQALVHLSPLEETRGGNSMQITTDSICMFLYEHNNSSTFSNQAPWRDPSIQNDNIRRLGPAAFRSFPSHHFFVRVFRHSAICTALLNRTPTFLESPEWKTVPWELHPKTLFDQLFDIMALLPSVLHRADRILVPVDQHQQHQQQNQQAQQHRMMMARRLMAQDLLQNCLTIERQFDEWWTAAANHAASQSQPSDLYWVEEPDDGVGASPEVIRGGVGGRSSVGVPSPSNSTSTGTTATTTAKSTSTTTSTTTQHPPFAETFAFPDPLTASMCIYAWTGLVQLCLCVERLYWAASFETPSPTGPPPPPPPQLPIVVGAMGIPSPGTEEVGSRHSPPHNNNNNNNNVASQINLLQYSLRVREMVGNICRSLDFALESTVQPDMLVVPLFVARQFYENVGPDPGLGLGMGTGMGIGVGDMGVNTGMGMGVNNMGSMGGMGGMSMMMDDEMGDMGVVGGADGGLLQVPGHHHQEVLSEEDDGRLELVWCDGFMERLKQRGRDIAEVVMGRRWTDLATY